MSAREHGIDRVAGAMTAGAPGPAFTARVMAPLHGLPQPGFTGRVIARLDAPSQGRLTRVLRPLGPALAAASVLALVAVLLPSLRPSRGLAVPAAPVLVDARVGAPGFATPAVTPIAPAAVPRVARGASSRTTRVQAAVAPAPASPERPLYQIAELQSPADLTIAPVAAPPPAVAPLERPSALIVPGLRFEKEKP